MTEETGWCVEVPVSVTIKENVMDKQQATKKISDKLEQAHKLIRECETLADAHDISFDWDISYGMGGYYSGTNGEWNASSESC
jgi:hypothetical protein